VLENVGPNGIFGEMALIDGSPRSASAVAREPTEVAVIDEKAFLYLVGKDPAFALDLLRQLTVRLRRTTESL
jgi:CRP-like cAMP-binding protein